MDADGLGLAAIQETIMESQRDGFYSWMRQNQSRKPAGNPMNQGFSNLKIFLVRPELLVKVSYTYETILYPYRTTGPGYGRYVGGLQQ